MRINEDFLFTHEQTMRDLVDVHAIVDGSPFDAVVTPEGSYPSKICLESSPSKVSVVSMMQSIML